MSAKFLFLTYPPPIITLLVGALAVINLYRSQKRLHIKVYKSGCERRDIVFINLSDKFDLTLFIHNYPLTNSLNLHYLQMPQLPELSNSQKVSQPDQASPKVLVPIMTIFKKLTKSLLIVAILIFLVIIIFDFQGKPFPWLWEARAWTGFGEIVDKNSLTVTEMGAEKTIIKTTTTDKFEPAKTLWDWMSLLLAPATLAGLGFWFQHLQQKAKNAKELVDKNAAEEQAKQERERAADQQREEALQNYLNYLSELLVDKQLKQVLHSQKEKPENEAAASTTVNPFIDAKVALNIIKARTLWLLRMFAQDIPRKASVLSFLGDADLLVDLHLDLSGSNWKKANFKRVNFKMVYLIDANLSGVNLSSANLSNAKLSSANLSDANLDYANLSGVNLSRANLSGANLSNTDLTCADLICADLSHAELRFAKLNDANLNRADLTDTDLTCAELYCADLKFAKLSDANLSHTNLTDADLYGADLNDAKNLTPEQVKLAKNWDKAKYSEKFYSVLGLPLETSAK